METVSAERDERKRWEDAANESKKNRKMLKVKAGR
jgi:hypothetical protein